MQTIFKKILIKLLSLPEVKAVIIKILSDAMARGSLRCSTHQSCGTNHEGRTL